MAKGVGNKGKGGGEPAGISVLEGSPNSLMFDENSLHLSMVKLRESSPLSKVANKASRDIVVIQIVAEVIRAVRRPQRSTTISANTLLNNFTTPRAMEVVISAASETIELTLIISFISIIVSVD